MRDDVQMFEIANMKPPKMFIYNTEMILLWIITILYKYIWWKSSKLKTILWKVRKVSKSPHVERILNNRQLILFCLWFCILFLIEFVESRTLHHFQVIFEFVYCLRSHVLYIFTYRIFLSSLWTFNFVWSDKIIATD